MRRCVFARKNSAENVNQNENQNQNVNRAITLHFMSTEYKDLSSKTNRVKSQEPGIKTFQLQLQFQSKSKWRTDGQLLFPSPGGAQHQ